MKKIPGNLTAAHGMLLLLLFTVIFVPNQRETVRSWHALAAGIVLMEAAFLTAYRRREGEKQRGCLDIILFVWTALLVWELCTSVLNIAHPVLTPCPENVFDTFRERWDQMLLNVWSSLQLLALGFFPGLAAAVGLGLAAGWSPRMRAFAAPLANVMAPIPAVVFSPYLVAVLPGFRSASAVVIFLGVFWPNFLATIGRVQAIEPEILDLARMLRLRGPEMVLKILLPAVFPGVAAGLKVSLTSALLMLNFAEMMGATHGMGYFIQNSIAYANYTHAVAGIIVTGLVVTGLNCAVSAFQARAVRWK